MIVFLIPLQILISGLINLHYFPNRDIGQGTVDEVRSKDLKRELDEREKASKDKSDRKDRDRERQPKSAIAFHSTQ